MSMFSLSREVDEDGLRIWMASNLPGHKKEILSRNITMQALLKDGTVLCELLNKMPSDGDRSKIEIGMGTSHTDDVELYIQGCKAIGIEANFAPEDIDRGRNMSRVMQSLQNLQKYQREKLDVKEKRENGEPSKFPFLRMTSSPSPLSPGRATSPTRSDSEDDGVVMKFFKSFTSRDKPPEKQESKANAAAAMEAAKKRPLSPPVSNEKKAEDKRASEVVKKKTIEKIEPIKPVVSNIQDDLATKEHFKYDHELERVVQEWIEAVLKEKFPADETFQQSLKSGVRLCRVVNVIQPNVISKISESRQAYHQMENISTFVKGCLTLGMREGDTFDPSDLFNDRNMSTVVGKLAAFIMFITKKNENLPKMEQTSTRNLYTQSLVTKKDYVPETEDCKVAELKGEEFKLLKWVNANLRTREEALIVKLFPLDLCCGVRILQLLEILSGSSVGKYVKKPTSMWEYMQNSSLILRFLRMQFFESQNFVKPVDIVKGNRQALLQLLVYIREKYDRDFFFQNALNNMEQGPSDERGQRPVPPPKPAQFANIASDGVARPPRPPRDKPSEEANVAKAQAMVKKRVMDELLSTEVHYLAGLERVVNKVVAETRHHKALSEEETTSIFANLCDIVKDQKVFLEKIRARVKNAPTATSPKEKEDTSIGNLFLKECESLRNYESYIVNYTTSQVCLTYIRATNKPFDDIVTAFEEKENGLFLPSFLIMPVQRIPRYGLLLRDIQKYTPESDDEHTLLGLAATYVNSIMNSINENVDLAVSDATAQLLLVNEMVTEFIPFLKDPSRRILHQGNIRMNKLSVKVGANVSTKKDEIHKRSVLRNELQARDRSRIEEMYWVLFQDTLLICEERGKGKDSFFRDRGSSRQSVISQGTDKPYNLLDQVSMTKVTVVTPNLEEMEKFSLGLGAETWELECEKVEDATTWYYWIKQNLREQKHLLLTSSLVTK
mmetsp:Transcript_4627/g.12959  ORF Transcript_4627/g.12959 Transcript_4627/m.12959 type:complete len:952 (+) Transcript_4627:214-3069(+)